MTTSLESRDQGGKQGRDSGHWANLVIFPINCLKNLSWCQRCPVCVWPGCSRLMDRWTNGGLDEQLSKENILIWHKICGAEREREISTWSKVQLLSFNFFISGFIDQDQRRDGRWDEWLWSKTLLLFSDKLPINTFCRPADPDYSDLLWYSRISLMSASLTPLRPASSPLMITLSIIITVISHYHDH